MSEENQTGGVKQGTKPDRLGSYNSRINVADEQRENTVRRDKTPADNPPPSDDQQIPQDIEKKAIRYMKPLWNEVNEKVIEYGGMKFIYDWEVYQTIIKILMDRRDFIQRILEWNEDNYVCTCFRNEIGLVKCHYCRFKEFLKREADGGRE